MPFTESDDQYDTPRARFLNRLRFDVDDYGPHYYDRSGEQILLGAWAERIEDPEYKTVARDSVRAPDGRLLSVSTIWLGLDHGMNLNNDPDYEPLIFETMVFDEAGEIVTQERYTREETAQEAHRMLVESLTIGARPISTPLIVCSFCSLEFHRNFDSCPRCGSPNGTPQGTIEE
jgi:hypothetical protein